MRNLRRFLELNYNYYLKGQTPAIVYSMERTGSVALFQSLCDYGVFTTCTHYMDPEKLGTEPQSGSARWTYNHVIDNHQPVKIISLVRHPIDNMLSIFARSEFSKEHPQSVHSTDHLGDSEADVLSRQFATQYLEKKRHLRQIDWFRTEFNNTLGIDVYQHPFNKKEGFVEFQERPLQVLIIRTETDVDRKSKLVSKFLGLPDFEMVKPTTKPTSKKKLPPGMPGDQTDYAQRYRTLKQEAMLPRKFFDEIVGSPFAQHFFSEQELVAMEERFQ